MVIILYVMCVLTLISLVVGFEKVAVCDFPQASETSDADLVLELMQADKEIEQASDIAEIE